MPWCIVFSMRYVRAALRGAIMAKSFLVALVASVLAPAIGAGAFYLVYAF